jgi:hypothetical protein
MYGGNEGIVLPVLIAVLDVGELSASCSCRFTPGRTVPCTLWTVTLVGPRAGLEAMEMRKILPVLGIELRAVQLVTRFYID